MYKERIAASDTTGKKSIFSFTFAYSGHFDLPEDQKSA